MDVFEGKGAVVTGGASGIGLAIATALVERGAKLALLDRDAEKLQQAVAALSVGGATVMGVVTDVSSKASMDAASREVAAAFGKVHVLVNCAGVVLRGVKVEDTSDEAFAWLMQVNLFGAIHGVQAFLPAMKAHGEAGHIINVASLSGFLVADRQTGPYCVSKFGAVAFSESLAIDLAKTNIGISIVAPGAVNSALYDSSVAGRAKADGSKIAGNTAYDTTPDDIATGMQTEEVARRVLFGVAGKQLYIFTHPQSRARVQQRFDRILAGYDNADLFNSAG